MFRSTRRPSLFGSAAVLAVMLSACASFPTQELDKASNTSLHVIAVAPIGMPDKPMVTIVNAVGNSFGLIGAVVEAARASNASNEAVNELASGGLAYKAQLPADIESSLKAAGFEVQMLQGARAANQTASFLTTLPAAPGADAVLDLYVSYFGYEAAGAQSAYRPAVHLEARLLDAKTQKVIFADQIYYNNFMPAAAKKAITIEPDAQAVFADRAAMRAAPADVARWLRVAQKAVADGLANQLK
ncbi:MAG: hypothetical protein JSR67_09590 [Proteobacteria bacterium]|nr:hypothetical protein [Pseudomonadota bacterium]